MATLRYANKFIVVEICTSGYYAQTLTTNVYIYLLLVLAISIIHLNLN
jgi:hypothetical protein